MTIRKYGFPQYGDSDALWQAGLRSATDVDGATLSGVNTPTYDADLGTCFHRLSALTKAIGAGYRDRLTITFWVSSEYLDQDYTPVANLYSTDTGNEMMIQLDMGTDAHIRKSANADHFTFAQSTTGATLPRLDMRGADTQVRCDVSCGHGGIVWYLEGLPIAKWPWRVAHAAPTIANIKFPGSASVTAHGPEYAYYRDVQVVPYEIALPSRNECNVVFLGDSFTKSGQYPLTDLEILGCQEEYYTGTTTQATTYSRNGGMIPIVHGRLMLSGVSPKGGRIRWYGRGGAGVTLGSSHLSDQVDRLLTGIGEEVETMGDHGRYENHPDIVCICIGANDILETDEDAWKAAYITELDRIYAAGARLIVINTLGPYTMESEYTTAAATDNVDALNVKVKEIAAYYGASRLSVIDSFNVLGGHANYDPQNFGLAFQAGDRHPSTKGQRIYGRLYADAILANGI